LEGFNAEILLPETEHPAFLARVCFFFRKSEDLSALKAGNFFIHFI